MQETCQDLWVHLEMSFLNHAVQQLYGFERRNAGKIVAEDADQGIQTQIRRLTSESIQALEIGACPGGTYFIPCLLAQPGHNACHKVYPKVEMCDIRGKGTHAFEGDIGQVAPGFMDAQRRNTRRRKVMPTFELGFKSAEIGLIHEHKALLPFTCPGDHLTDLFSLFLVRQSSYPISRNDVFEHRKLRKDGQLAYCSIISDWDRMRRGGDRLEGKSMQATK